MTMRCIENIAQVERRRGILRRQLDRVMFIRAAIACGKCRWPTATFAAYKCYYCGIWFCSRCAGQHFR